MERRRPVRRWRGGRDDPTRAAEPGGRTCTLKRSVTGRATSWPSSSRTRAANAAPAPYVARCGRRPQPFRSNPGEPGYRSDGLGNRRWCALAAAAPARGHVRRGIFGEPATFRLYWAYSSHQGDRRLRRRQAPQDRPGRGVGTCCLLPRTQHALSCRRRRRPRPWKGPRPWSYRLALRQSPPPNHSAN